MSPRSSGGCDWTARWETWRSSTAIPACSTATRVSTGRWARCSSSPRPRLYGVDANNDGKVSPDNFDDAALSAAGYLCWRGKDLATPRGWMNALRAYNRSDQYARTVRDWATAYANGHPL